MTCKTCSSERIAFIFGKCSDRCVYSYGDNERDGYVPYNVGIGGGDDIQFTYCLDCGQIQGKDFPISQDDLDELFERY